MANDGVAEMAEKLRRLETGAAALFAKALEATLTADEVPACQDVTPVDTGAMRASIHALPGVVDGDVIHSGVIAGEDSSGAENYTVVQHEDLFLNHPNGGAAKFVERPMRNLSASLLERMVARIRLESLL